MREEIPSLTCRDGGQVLLHGVEHLGKDTQVKGRCVEASVDRHRGNADEPENTCRKYRHRYSCIDTGSFPV